MATAMLFLPAIVAGALLFAVGGSEGTDRRPRPVMSGHADRTIRTGCVQHPVTFLGRSSARSNAARPPAGHQ